jgi:hypothetical protein
MAGEDAGFGKWGFVFQTQQAINYPSQERLNLLLFNKSYINFALFVHKGGTGCCLSYTTVI